jgi:predicted enzyme related to lactoylglutathione lyase
MEILINVDVPDLDAAVEFYGTGLGLRLGRRLWENTVIEMIGPHSPIYLMVKESGTTASKTLSQRRDYTRHWTPIHLDFVVKDIETAVKTAISAGAKLEDDIKSFPWAREAYLSDPFGHGFCILEMTSGGFDLVASPGETHSTEMKNPLIPDGVSGEMPKILSRSDKGGSISSSE